MNKIAIIGATSHIAKGLIYIFSQHTERYEVDLFARNINKLSDFLLKENMSTKFPVSDFSKFCEGKYEVIINCIGTGTPIGFKTPQSDIMRTTEQFDNMILDYLAENTESLYINMSSGAVYGKDYIDPINQLTCPVLDVNNLSESDSYFVAKINAEVKHRALQHLNIVDLRVFSYFSRFIELEAGYLVTDMIKSLINDKPFETNNADIIRDYVSHEEIFQLIEKCIEKQKINDWFDVYSLKEIRKFELLDFYKQKFGLNWKLKDGLTQLNTGGIKSCYFSTNRKATEILGYNPRFTSLEIVKMETDLILRVKK